jgi:hypothetical protein
MYKKDPRPFLEDESHIRHPICHEIGRLKTKSPRPFLEDESNLSSRGATTIFKQLARVTRLFAVLGPSPKPFAL